MRGVRRKRLIWIVDLVRTNVEIESDGDRVVRSFPEDGNMGPAAMPVTLARVQDNLEPGDGVMFQGMGSGINAAIVEIEW